MSFLKNSGAANEFPHALWMLRQPSCSATIKPDFIVEQADVNGHVEGSSWRR
jgi:hypothetical protein